MKDLTLTTHQQSYT